MSKTVCAKTLNEEILYQLFHAQLRPMPLLAYELRGCSSCPFWKRAIHVTDHRLPHVDEATNEQDCIASN